MENQEGLKELAWLYLAFDEALNSFPSSIGDLIQAPKWFKSNEPGDDDPIYKMMEVADKLAEQILKKK